MSDGYKITVKWGKETVQLNSFTPDVGVKGLKAELEERTSVPIDRQKIMAKSKGLWKGVLKDDFDLTSLDWNNVQKKAGTTGITLLLMGSASTLSGPKTKTVFMEDLPPEKMAQVVDPAGLANLGNTCYMNSVVQCLRAIPTLRAGLLTYTPPPNAAAQQQGGAAAGAMAAAAAAGGGRPPSMVMAIRRQFVTALRDTLQSLDMQADPYKPVALLQATQMQFPNFAQRNPANGQPMQQDAEEFLNGLCQALSTEMNGWDNIRKAFTHNSGDGGTAGDSSTTPTGITQDELLGAGNVIDALFGLKIKEVLTCDEFDHSNDTKTSTDDAMQVEGAAALTEPPVESFDLHRKLVCNIQGGSDGASTVNVSHVAEGIRISLQDKIMKHSDVLGRNAMWTRNQRIARLPSILCVQFGRFYWKATPDNPDHAGVKCKVMKPVAFTTTLDLYEFCSKEIQDVLKVSRDKARIAMEKELEAKEQAAKDAMGTSSNNKKKTTKDDDDNKNKKEDATGEQTDSKPSATEEKVAEGDSMQVENTSGDAEEQAALQAALAMSMQEDLAPAGPGLPNEFQGIYELFAVVTHKGRDADGGHYMAWVKAPTLPKAPSSEEDDKNSSIIKKKKIADTDVDDEDWYVYDDDEVSPCKTEDVLKLKGGGDWHMSYLNFYRAKK